MAEKRKDDNPRGRKDRNAGTTGGTWQAHKSANMRRLILEAAMDAIVEYGYARVTTQIIVERAGVSRGAMLHHFPKKQDLLAALVQYIFDRRNTEFTGELIKSADSSRGDDLRALDIYWTQSKNPSFVAMVELSIAARTDPQLAAAFLPISQKISNEVYTEHISGFSDWSSDFEAFETAADLVRCVVLGLTVAYDIRISTTRRDKVLNLAREAIKRLRPQGASA